VSYFRPFGGIAEATKGDVWVGGFMPEGDAPVTIERLGGYGVQEQILPTPRYTDVSGYDSATTEKLRKPQRYLEGMAANAKYLWAWFMGDMIMVANLTGKTEWRPHRYAVQFGHPYYAEGGPEDFTPLRGWAWRDRFICLLAPVESQSQSPNKIGVVLASQPDRGISLEPPRAVGYYRPLAAAISGDYLYVLGPVGSDVQGYKAGQYALTRVSLSDFRWELCKTPAGLKAWRPLTTDLPDRSACMALGSNWLALGTRLGPTGKSDLIVVDMKTEKLTALSRNTGNAVTIHDLAFNGETLWVGHEVGLSGISLSASPR
jgi:hypothetical protein